MNSEQKRLSTNKLKYGVEHPLQDKKLLLKFISNPYRSKSFISPNGNIIFYQGYEREILEYCYKTIDESFITNERKNIPIIQYNWDNKICHYFPNIYIKARNLLIDIKSTYIFDRNIEKNLAKHKASLDSGFDHKIFIWNPSKNCIDQIIKD